MKSFVLFLALLFAPAAAFSEEASTPPVPAAQHPADHAMPAKHGEAAEKDTEPHPTLPDNPTWPRTVGIVILTLFILAAAVGTLARMNMPEEPPAPADDHGHDANHDHHDEHAPAPDHGHGAHH
jgi:Spy/CpxP family protein refolding chaperone